MDRNDLGLGFGGGQIVALRKESVDRNKHPKPAEQAQTCRSPQGERG